MDALTVYLEGIGTWSPQWPDWDTAAALLRDERIGGERTGKPAASVLAPGERRRAPELILLACESAAQACAAARRDAAQLPCVFASAHGDVATVDAICATLASAPLELSPTRFHNSVHNAAVGYWTVATGCRAASTAIAAGEATMAAGLLEAGLQALADQRPVVLIACETSACGPLAEVLRAGEALALALVLNATASERTIARLRLHHDVATADVAEHSASNAMHELLSALALGTTRLHLRSTPNSSLRVEIDA